MADHNNARETGATKYPAKRVLIPLTDFLRMPLETEAAQRNWVDEAPRPSERQDAPVRWPKHDDSP
ncbi:hypothetical protein BQ8794_70539 [Mesorhizobium prunaredense]|uniref:Uncharacterized protein n=1 Tax=Mesorhizobium prunaredense TaxID=1631249 RepID=A0A1R3VI52_9HYPH|nr:hypothetical protein BQ8794_70539 [Mesorhizobium prunaredense]